MSQRVEDILRRPGHFALSIWRGFRSSQGVLLASAVAYNAMLSVVPLFALVLLVLSVVTERALLISTLASELELVVPGYSETLLAQVEAILDNSELASGLALVVLLVFSSMAFSVLQRAMSVIFHHRPSKDRSFVVSFLIPYAFVGLLGIGVLVVTFIAEALGRMERMGLHVMGLHWRLAGASGVVLYVLGFVGLVLMLTAFYWVMPVGKIAVRHALIGGLTAALLWEVTRHALVWYFSTLSMVPIVYGSLAATVVALLSFEVAAVILLLGAQVIAEFERHDTEDGS
jgi:YihY family inner membrane protein